MTTPETDTTRASVDSIIENLIDIGAVWARYGLTVGRAALETSAKTLGNTAEVLGELSKRFETDRTQSH
jgi:head-tail adaptor